jgi:hypothetical protein
MVILNTGAGASAPAPIFFARGDAAQKMIRELVKWWHSRYPLEVKGYRKEVKILRETLRTKGMSVDGTLMQSMTIPTRISIMAEKLIPGFWNNGGRDLWQREFTAFRIKD